MISKILRTSNKLTQGASQQFSNKITIEVPAFVTHKLDGHKLPTSVETDKNQVEHMYRQMYRIRRMEIACDTLYKNQEIRGFCHLYDGQEAVIVGMEEVLTYEDCLITAYRDHGHALTRGDSVHQIIAEMLGKSTGSSKGKGGSMHYYRSQNNFYGGNGIVGAQVPVGAGLAFAQKYLGKKDITVTMYGDGAANQGQLFEAANMAALWKLPLVMMCENNRYAMGTCISRHAAHPSFYDRDQAVPGLKVDGMNVFPMMAALQFAKQYCPKNGPLFVEADTYRYHGHSMSDPGISYRSRDEVMEVRKTLDPLIQLQKVIQEHNLFTENELKSIESEIKQEIDEAIAKARSDPLPNMAELVKDVYIKESMHYTRGCDISDTVYPNGRKENY